MGCQHRDEVVPLSSAVYYMVKVIIRVYTVVEPSTTHHIHKVSCDRQIQYFRGWPIEEVGMGGLSSGNVGVELDSHRTSGSAGGRGSPPLHGIC